MDDNAGPRITNDGPGGAGDGLYALALDQFVAARNALADALKKKGDNQAARAVRALSKPAFSAWVTNQTVRGAPELVGQLLQATDALADAQRTVGRAGNTQDRFWEATAEQRRVLGALVLVARRVLAEAGHSDEGAVLEKVENNLRWSAISPEVRDAFLAGRLVRDVSPPGFSVLSGGSLEADGDAPPPMRSVDPAPARQQARADADAEANSRRQHQLLVKGLETELLRARADAVQASREHEVRQATVRKHEARVDAAEGVLATARAALATARTVVEAAAQERAVLDEKRAHLEDRLSRERKQP